MGWKKVTQQLNFFSEPEPEQAPEEPTPSSTPKRRRSENYILQSYTAKNSGKCSSMLGSCHRDGKIEVGHDMVRAIPMKGVPGPHFFFHDGKCLDDNIAKIDSDATKAIMGR